MKRNIIFFIIGAMLFSAGAALGAGVVKHEYTSLDAASAVGYGSADAGDSIVRIKTEADGTLVITGV